MQLVRFRSDIALTKLLTAPAYPATGKKRIPACHFRRDGEIFLPSFHGPGPTATICGGPQSHRMRRWASQRLFAGYAAVFQTCFDWIELLEPWCRRVSSLPCCASVDGLAVETLRAVAFISRAESKWGHVERWRCRWDEAARPRASNASDESLFDGANYLHPPTNHWRRAFRASQQDGHVSRRNDGSQYFLRSSLRIFYVLPPNFQLLVISNGWIDKRNPSSGRQVFRKAASAGHRTTQRPAPASPARSDLPCRNAGWSIRDRRWTSRISAPWLPHPVGYSSALSLSWSVQWKRFRSDNAPHLRETDNRWAFHSFTREPLRSW